METKKQYIAPELTVVTFKAERGYQASSQSLTTFNISSILGISTPVVSSQESWSEEVNLFGDNTWDNN